MSPAAGSDTRGGRFLPATHGLRGSVRVQGDKSISHRALLLGSVSSNATRVAGLLRSADTLATIGAVRALGVEVEDLGDDLVVHGAGWAGLSEPTDVIDVANSGTLIRLLPGLVASRDIFCVLTGDSSIRRRPMGRVLDPLADMGATVAGRAGNKQPPLSIRGGGLKAVDHRLAVASAQVKSCLLLAGLRADGITSIAEPGQSRDHTERMIRQGGGRVEREETSEGAGVVRVWPLDELRLTRVDVPGDFSSAAFLIVGALLVPGSEVTIDGVGLNPTRTGLLAALGRMRADVQVQVADPEAYEPYGRVTVRFSDLTATDIEPHEIPNVIDELPAFLLAAARAKGTTRVRGAQELRVKESDRLSAMTQLLSTLGVSVEERADGLIVTGRPQGWDGGHVVTHADHRLAMVGALAGYASRTGVTVDDIDCMSVSFPGFADTLGELGGPWEAES
jgi:3-phosphoshikimate 1-carboxyvinyltransferase